MATDGATPCGYCLLSARAYWISYALYIVLVCGARRAHGTARHGTERADNGQWPTGNGERADSSANRVQWNGTKWNATQRAAVSGEAKKRAGRRRGESSGDEFVYVHCTALHCTVQCVFVLVFEVVFGLGARLRLRIR